MFKTFAKFRGNEKPASRPNVAQQRRISEPTKKDLALTAPKNIVRAVYPYTAQHGDELSFNKNDFFYVNEEPMADWYLASNPLTGVRGLVPKPYFEVIQRQDPHSVPISQARAAREESPGKETKPTLYVYGFILYNFQAERTDELTVSGGESVVITAQSNEEWFVAKPIGRLGGPGLVPVSYIELREVGTDMPLTNVTDAIKRAQIPQVDEWKRRLAQYKAGSISLSHSQQQQQRQNSQSSQGHHQHSRSKSQVSFKSRTSLRSSKSPRKQNPTSVHSNVSTPSTDQRSPDKRSPEKRSPERKSPDGRSTPIHYRNPSSQSNQSNQSKSMDNIPTMPHMASMSSMGSLHSAHSFSSQPQPYIVSASVDQRHGDGLKYWYLVKVQVSNGRHRSLCRYYQDFYDFQIKLLEQFPEESGRTGKERTIPFLPVPSPDWEDRVTSLDGYVKQILQTPETVSRSAIVEQLFDLRKGDVESAGPTDLLPEVSEGQTEQNIDPIEPLNTSIQNTPNESTQGAQGAQSSPVNPLSSQLTNQSSQSNLSNQSRQSNQSAQSALSTQSGNTMTPTNSDPEQPVRKMAQLTLNTSALNSASTLIPPPPQSNDDLDSQRSMSLHSGNTQSLKIKVYKGDSVIAMKLPVESSFSEISAKISARLGSDSVDLFADRNYTERVDGPGAFARALNGGNKVAFFAS